MNDTVAISLPAFAYLSLSPSFSVAVSPLQDLSTPVKICFLADKFVVALNDLARSSLEIHRRNGERPVNAWKIVAGFRSEQIYQKNSLITRIIELEIPS